MDISHISKQNQVESRTPERAIRAERVSENFIRPETNISVISEEIPTRPIEGNEKGYMAELKQEFGNVDLDVRVRFEEDLKMMVVDILDNETKELIKSIPPEYVIEMRKKMRAMSESGGLEGRSGILVDMRV